MIKKITNKKMIMGFLLIMLGVVGGILWRLRSARYANYDNFDPSLYLILPGLIIYIIGLNKEATAKKWRLLGNVFVVIGGYMLLGLSAKIGTTVYGGGFNEIVGLSVYCVIISLLPIGSLILLRSENK
jgi:hypothetical protein